MRPGPKRSPRQAEGHHNELFPDQADARRVASSFGRAASRLQLQACSERVADLRDACRRYGAEEQATC